MPLRPAPPRAPGRCPGHGHGRSGPARPRRPSPSGPTPALPASPPARVTRLLRPDAGTRLSLLPVSPPPPAHPASRESSRSPPRRRPLSIRRAPRPAGHFAEARILPRHRSDHGSVPFRRLSTLYGRSGPWPWPTGPRGRVRTCCYHGLRPASPWAEGSRTLRPRRSSQKLRFCNARLPHPPPSSQSSFGLHFACRFFQEASLAPSRWLSSRPGGSRRVYGTGQHAMA